MKIMSFHISKTKGESNVVINDKMTENVDIYLKMLILNLLSVIIFLCKLHEFIPTPLEADLWSLQ